MGRAKGNHQRNELVAEKEIKNFLRKCAPYKMEFKGYALSYQDYEVNYQGDIIVKYKLERK